MHFGIVKNINDPEKLGRVKVKVFDIHDNIETYELGWSQVMMSGNTPAINGQGHSVNLTEEVLWKKGDTLPTPITGAAGQVLTEVDDDTTPAIGDVKIVGSLVCGIFLDPVQQEFMVIGSLPTKTDGVHDNNVRVRGEADPHAAEPLGEYQPVSTYAPEYPYNNVYETEGGHVKEYDDTPGLERITERHKSGTKYEIDANGSKNETIVRDNYKLVAGHDTLEVFGNVRIIVSGQADIAVANDVNIAVGGDMVSTIEGALIANVGGVTKVTSTDDITLKSNNIWLDGNVNVTEVLKTDTKNTNINLNTHKHGQNNVNQENTDGPNNN
jgi:hypothetical protein